MGDEKKQAKSKKLEYRTELFEVIKEGWWEYEADQRHADLIIQEAGAANMSSLIEPGGDKKAMGEEEKSEELVGAEATRFRAVAARAN